MGGVWAVRGVWEGGRRAEGGRLAGAAVRGEVCLVGRPGRLANPAPPPTAPHPPGQVSDEGGGIPRSGLPKMWTYLYTTAKSPLEEMERGQSEGSDGPAVLAG